MIYFINKDLDYYLSTLICNEILVWSIDPGVTNIYTAVDYSFLSSKERIRRCLPKNNIICAISPCYP